MALCNYDRRCEGGLLRGGVQEVVVRGRSAWRGGYEGVLGEMGVRSAGRGGRCDELWRWLIGSVGMTEEYMNKGGKGKCQG